MLRRNPPRQASREDRRMSYNQAFLSSPPSSTSKAKTSSPSMNRKRIRDEPSTQQPAKRQSNVPTTIDSQISPAIVARSSQRLQQPQVIQPVVSPDSLDEDAAKITRRIGDYKSRLQNLEAEHKALSQDRDPETVSGMKKTLGDTTARRKKTATKLHKIKYVIKRMAKTIKDCRDVVPSQLHQALKASRTDRDNFEIKLRKIGDLETKQIQQLKDAERKYDEAGAKLEDLDKQMNKCKLNLRSTEKDLNNVLLQRRLSDLSRVNVSALPYDQRFHLAKLAEQMTAVLEGGSETYTA